MHFGLVPDAHLDAALEIGDLDLAVGMERTGFVDRGGGQRRGGQGRQQQRQEAADGHGGDSVRLRVWLWTGAATGPVAGRRGFAGGRTGSARRGPRSEERRVGKEGGGTCGNRWA